MNYSALGSFDNIRLPKIIIVNTREAYEYLRQALLEKAGDKAYQFDYRMYLMKMIEYVLTPDPSKTISEGLIECKGMLTSYGFVDYDEVCRIEQRFLCLLIDNLGIAYEILTVARQVRSFSRPFTIEPQKGFYDAYIWIPT